MAVFFSFNIRLSDVNSKGVGRIGSLRSTAPNEMSYILSLAAWSSTFMKIFSPLFNLLLPCNIFSGKPWYSLSFTTNASVSFSLYLINIFLSDGAVAVIEIDFPVLFVILYCVAVFPFNIRLSDVNSKGVGRIGSLRSTAPNEMSNILSLASSSSTFTKTVSPLFNLLLPSKIFPVFPFVHH